MKTFNWIHTILVGTIKYHLLLIINFLLTNLLFAHITLTTLLTSKFPILILNSIAARDWLATRRVEVFIALVTLQLTAIQDATTAPQALFVQQLFVVVNVADDWVEFEVFHTRTAFYQRVDFLIFDFAFLRLVV